MILEATSKVAANQGTTPKEEIERFGLRREVVGRLPLWPRGGGRRVCHGAPATSAPVDHASRASWGRTARPPTVPVVEPRGVRNPRVGRDSTEGVDELAVPLERRVRSRAFTAERIAPRQVPRPRPRPSRRRASRLGARRRSALVVARRGGWCRRAVWIRCRHHRTGADYTTGARVDGLTDGDE